MTAIRRISYWHPNGQFYHLRSHSCFVTHPSLDGTAAAPERRGALGFLKRSNGIFLKKQIKKTEERFCDYLGVLTFFEKITQCLLSFFECMYKVNEF